MNALVYLKDGKGQTDSLLTTEPEEIGGFVLKLFCAADGLRWVCGYTLDDAKERFDGRKSCHWEITHGKKLER